MQKNRGYSDARKIYGLCRELIDVCFADTQLGVYGLNSRIEMSMEQHPSNRKEQPKKLQVMTGDGLSLTQKSMKVLVPYHSHQFIVDT